MADRFGTPFNPFQCWDVLDNTGPDTNPISGTFTIDPLAFGTYSVTETIPPPGFRGDPTVVVVHIVDLDDSDGDPDNGPDVEIAYRWVNTSLGRLTPTGTTCDDFLGGTALDFTEVWYRVKQGLINNTAPGVFFYYTQFAVGVGTTDVSISQTVSEAGYEFAVQNAEQVRVFNPDCSPYGTWPLNSWVDGQVEVSIDAGAAQTIILSVKYATTNIAGMTQPVAEILHYDFATLIGATVVDFDSDGLDLKPKNR